MDKIRISKIIHESMHTVPDFFKYKEAPCVLYTRTKCIRSDILNYHQTINDIKIDEWKNKDYSCDCQTSEFCDSHHQHIVTGNLDIIENDFLRELMQKGPTYRESRRENWKVYIHPFTKMQR